MSNITETALSVLGDGSTTGPTITEAIEDESGNTLTIIIFVISAILVTILIFTLAIFIDCRQQKIQNSKIKNIKRRTKQKIRRVFPTLPTIGEIPHEDTKTIVDNMYTEHTDIP